MKAKIVEAGSDYGSYKHAEIIADTRQDCQEGVDAYCARFAFAGYATEVIIKPHKNGMYWIALMKRYTSCD